MAIKGSLERFIHNNASFVLRQSLFFTSVSPLPIKAPGHSLEAFDFAVNDCRLKKLVKIVRYVVHTRLKRMKFALYETAEYKVWLKTQTLKSQRQILDRLSKIEEDGHFGHNKYLEDDIWELKFNDGRRIYYGFIKKFNIMLLLGGNKNGQDKDIKKAAKIFRKIAEA